MTSEQHLAEAERLLAESKSKNARDIAAQALAAQATAHAAIAGARVQMDAAKSPSRT